MINRIIVCGGNGAGKSTLGRELANKINFEFRDIEDYYFSANNTSYNYETARTKEEVSSLLLEDIQRHDNFLLASVKGNYGTEISSLFTCAVFVTVPKDVRMKRVKDRSYKKFGHRMLAGGDLYEKEKSFFDMVENRSEEDVEEWLQSLDIPVIKVDGRLAVDVNIEKIKEFIKKKMIKTMD